MSFFLVFQPKSQQNLLKMSQKYLTANTDKALAVLDLGSGDGQFAFYANKKAKNCRIFCEDIAPQNLEFISLYAQHNQVENLRCLIILEIR